MTTEEQRSHLGVVARQIINVFGEISAGARKRLADLTPPSLEAFASANSFTMGEALRNITEVDVTQREACERLAREPAIARVIVEEEDGTRKTFFIARGAAQAPSVEGVNVASYHSETGRLAASSPGDWVEVTLPSGPKGYDIIERALLRPMEDSAGWDAINTVFETEAFGPVTIESLRRLLMASGATVEEVDEVERLLREEDEIEGVALGLRRSLIAKMGLRDQPVLDRFQDEIFRLPIDISLAVLGPPGTGKTTTLIRRLGQKLDLDNMQPSEVAVITRVTDNRREPHSRSWLMLTPTELLRHYVKEAFAREGIAASDQRIRTWATVRRDLARNCFNVLRTGTGGGTFIQRENEPSISSAAVADTIGWFEDFQDWQIARFWRDLSEAAEVLKGSDRSNLAALGARLVTATQRVAATTGPSAILSLVKLAIDVRAALEQLRAESNAELRLALNTQLRQNPAFVDELAAFMDTVAEGGEDAETEEDPESEDEEEERQPQTRRGAAIIAYNSALRAQARGHTARRRPTRGRAAQILRWLKDRGLPEAKIEVVGESLALQRALRRFSNPVRTLINGTPQRYRAFRRTRRGEDRWYTQHQAGRYINPLEVDLVLLAMLHASTTLLRNARVQRALDDPSYAVLTATSAQFRNQILVDEATDFSPVQLACMAALATPSVESFFVCGDFNQRITNWGARTEEELRWVRNDIDIRQVVIAYRQSRQLHDFARLLVEISGGLTNSASLPEHVDNEGVAPALATEMSSMEDSVRWLATRIVEIETALKPNPLPSIAVLVNEEDAVIPIADLLNATLEEHNLRAVACVNGQMIGQDNEVRVFDVQHIKGLEFEAVFFLGIDRLAEREPELFDKYLYVGATRAATYLGLTCEGDLPARISRLQPMFGSGWQ